MYYIGNSVLCTLTTVTASHIAVDGEIKTYHEAVTIEDELEAQYYDDYSQAVANYWKYVIDKNNNFKLDYTFGSCNLSVLGSNSLFNMPTADGPNMVQNDN